ncbi:MAG: hypothetical protein JO336_10550 [Acidobacteriia bacterium]|nr:hypothetical protein [Terriglobia bacterium]
MRHNKKPADWTTDGMQSFAPQFTPDLAELLDPKRGLESRAVPGGTAPSAVREALKNAHEVLERIPRSSQR